MPRAAVALNDFFTARLGAYRLQIILLSKKQLLAHITRELEELFLQNWAVWFPMALSRSAQQIGIHDPSVRRECGRALVQDLV